MSGSSNGLLNVTLDDDTFQIPIVGDAEDLTGADGTIYEFYEFLRGDYTGIYNVYSEADRLTPVNGQLNSEGVLLLGLETRPSVMETLTGSARYTGQFNGGGGLFDESGDFVRDGREAQGNITLDINFADQMVSAELEGELDGATDFVGSVASMEIDGNGYSCALMTECESGITCTSNSVLSGNFFGPAAEEAAGLIDFDVTITVDADGEERRYLGVSGFAAGEAFEHADLSPGGGSGPPPLPPAPPGP